MSDDFRLREGGGDGGGRGGEVTSVETGRDCLGRLEEDEEEEAGNLVGKAIV